jgi:GT2 family glycosyltransferase
MRFSVIIPTFNRPEALLRCLAALARLHYPRDAFEVIVVDDGGTADLQPVTAAHQQKIQIALVRQANQGPAAARNTGAARAAGGLLAFLDDDCEAMDGWLLALDAAVTAAPGALIGGSVVNGLPGNRYAAASQAIFDFFCQHFNKDPEHGRFFPSNNIAVAADLYHEIGGFDANFRGSASEDRDLCDRWLRSGRRLAAAPRAVIVHCREMSARDFWRQHFQYGRGAYTYKVALRRRTGGAVPFEGWRFHAGMVTAPLRASIRPNALFLTFLILASQVAVVLGYVCEWWSHRRQSPGSEFGLARKISR